MSMNGIKMIALKIFKKCRSYICAVASFILIASSGGAMDLGRPMWPDVLFPMMVAFILLGLLIFWQHDLKIPDEVMDTPLEDNCLETGGIAYEGETLRDFMEENGISPYTSLYEVNDILWQCGIRKIPVKSMLTTKKESH